MSKLGMKDAQAIILIARMVPVFYGYPLAKRHRPLLCIDHHVRLALETVVSDTALFDVFSYMRSVMAKTDEGQVLLNDFMKIVIDGRTSRRIMCKPEDVVSLIRRYVEVSGCSLNGLARRALLSYFHKSSASGKIMRKEIHADRMSLTRLRNEHKEDTDNFLLPLYAGQIYAGLRQM